MVPELVESLCKSSAESNLFELCRGAAKDIKGPSPSLSPYHHPRNGAKKRLLRYETAQNHIGRGISGR